ncbi:MAG: flagellar hook-associated protein FlgK [Hyphomicrobiales bacterium]|nr:flagellar hook-associated protein FlgK [Hyphomicrobiales bacterium]MCP5373630.1 flagellar hook-associated protein FlgK [Hyphomicrobiales bacterium]
MSGSLVLALRTAQSGLLTHQAALDAIANNVANVNTDGYSRKIVQLESRVVDGTGAGVQIGEITRSIDEGLLRSLRTELSNYSSLDVRTNYYDRLQELFGTPDDNTSISHLLTELSNALESLAVRPDQALEQAEVARWGAEVTSRLQDMSDVIQELRRQADVAIATAVTEINDLVARIGDLNDKIVRNSSVGQDVTDLKDQRDLALDRLSELVDISYFNRGDGDIVVYTTGGRTLVDNIPGVLTHDAAASVTPTTTHAEGDFGGLYIGSTALTTNDITNEIRGGELKGLIDLRDGVLPDMQSQLDELAAEMRDVFNQIHNRGAPFPGMQTATGTREFVDSSTQTITFGSGDTTIALFDGNGEQQALSTLVTILGGTGPFTVDAVAAGIETWLQANGAAAATAAVNADGFLDINLNSTTLNMVLRDETATANGSTASDATIQFDADGDGDIDETVSGFSYFFGLNDFFVDGQPDNVWESDVLPGATTATVATLTFRDSTGLLGNIAVSAGDTLDEIVTAVNNAGIGITASKVPDGAGYRLRFASDDGTSITVTQDVGGGDSLLTDIGLHSADVRVASALEVRSDILAAPGLIAGGAMQWDADLGTAGEYRMGVADGTIAVSLANAFASTNAFDTAGGLVGVTNTFAQFAAAIVSDNATLAATNTADLDYQKTLTQSLQTKSDTTRGVNLDEEMAELIVFEQAYSAAARVISIIQNMFEALDAAVS